MPFLPLPNNRPSPHMMCLGIEPMSTLLSPTLIPFCKRPALQQEPNVYLEPKWLRCSLPLLHQPNYTPPPPYNGFHNEGRRACHHKRRVPAPGSSSIEYSLRLNTLSNVHEVDKERKRAKNLVHFSICACHPCAGAMLIFSVSFQFYRMIPEGNPKQTTSRLNRPTLASKDFLFPTYSAKE